MNYHRQLQGPPITSRALLTTSVEEADLRARLVQREEERQQQEEECRQREERRQEEYQREQEDYHREVWLRTGGVSYPQRTNSRADRPVSKRGERESTGCCDPCSRGENGSATKGSRIETCEEHPEKEDTAEMQGDIPAELPKLETRLRPEIRRRDHCG